MPVPHIHSHIFAASLPSCERFVSAQTIARSLARADIDLRALSDPPLFIPLGAQAALAEALARETGERVACISMKHWPYGAYGVYSDFVLSADNLGQAINRGIRAFKYIYRVSEITFYRDGDNVHLGFLSHLNGFVGARHIDEGFIWVLINLIRHFAGSSWLPERVELASVDNGSVSALEHIFETNLRIGSGEVSIIFDRRLLKLPNPSIISGVDHSTFRDLRLLLRVAPGDRTMDLVMHTIDLQLRMGDVSVEKVAARLGLSVRSLQRRLKAESETYQDCLDKVRLGRAKGLLAETVLPINEIAKALGFEEENSFRRAFRKWTGISAASYRRSLHFKLQC